MTAKANFKEVIGRTHAYCALTGQALAPFYVGDVEPGFIESRMGQLDYELHRLERSVTELRAELEKHKPAARLKDQQALGLTVVEGGRAA